MRILHGLALRRRFIRILQGRDLALKRAAARGCGCNEVLCGEGGPCARGCGAGYALAIFIPAALFCIFPITVLRWCLVGGATATSALFILANLRAPIFEHTGAKYDTPHPPPPLPAGRTRAWSLAHISHCSSRDPCSFMLHVNADPRDQRCCDCLPVQLPSTACAFCAGGDHTFSARLVAGCE